MELKKEPWLSVVIPVYNAVEKYFRKCIDSILNQSFKDFELLLIDDGSTDNTSDICKGYELKDNRVRYINKENGGPFQTRLFGAEHACGRYITFCDADDFYIHKDVFLLFNNKLSEERYSVLQFGFIHKFNHMKLKKSMCKTPIYVNRELFLSQEYPVLLCSYWEPAHLTTNTCNKVYHRKLFANLPASNSVGKIFWGEDLVLNLHLLKDCESCCFIPDALYCYRIFSGGTKKFSLSVMDDVDNIKNIQLSFLKEYDGASKEIMERNLFAEVAGWFFCYIQQAVDYLDDEQLISLINKTIKLPHFELARNYFVNVNNENWEAVNLLRKADAKEYIIKAKEAKKANKLKAGFKGIIKKIYTSI